MPITKLGAVYSGVPAFEGGFLFGIDGGNSIDDSKFSCMLAGPSLSCEVGRKNGDLVFAPKLSIEWYSFFIGGRFSGALYFKNDQRAYYLIPEGGISLFSVVNIWVGGNIPLISSFREITPLRVSLTVNLIPGLLK